MSRKGRMVKGSLRRVAVTVISGIIFLAVFSTNLFSQIERANELYNSLEYSKAIPLYIKALKKEENIEAVRNLAHCYFITHDYHQAEIFYEKAIKLGDTSPEVQINYGRVLKNNRKYDEAKEVFVVYAGKNPDDLKGKAYAVSVDKLKTWKEDEPVFEVSSMAEINSPVADFSPVMYRNGIAFTSEREKDNVTDLVYGLNNRPYLSVFLSELKKDSTLDAPKLFKGKINGDYHNGPVSFNNDFSLAVFTRVMNLKRGKEFTNRPQLFIADSDKNKWKKAVPFEHNSSEYSLAHPAISPDGNLLVFVSDMPGGFGGKDLFVSHKTATGWSKPENLGAEINTFGNEMFPSFGKDGTLFFSSDGHVGYGGLDIFSSKKEDNTWGKPENLKEPLNSSTDDFGITFTDAKNGYFSSNRPGGLGDDDIYKFKIIREKKESTKITGVFLYSKLKPGANVSIALLDENDNEIQVVKTNEKGEFVFDKLKPEMNYVVRIKEEDARITDQSVVYITNSNGEAVEQMVQPKKGYFVFHSLPSERYDKLPPLLDLKDIITPKAILYGQIYEKLPGDVPTGLNVHIINDNGEIIYTTTTTEDGFFAFENLPFEKGYTLKLAEPNTKAKIMIFDENKHLVKTISKNKGNDLFYVLLPKAENDVDMLGAKDNSKMLLNDFIGQVYKKLPGDVPSGIEVYLVDDNGKIVMTTYTDATGKFEFNKLPSDKNYTIKFKDSPDASPMQLIALNDKGEKMADLTADAKGNFNYEKLKADWAKMAALSTVDAAMYKTLSGQVYKTIPGDVGEGIDVYLINELGEVVFITKTDASGKFRFTRLPLEANYTVKLKDLKDSEIKLVTYNEKGDKTSEIKKNKSGDFVYVTLGSDKSSMLSMADAKDGKPVLTRFLGQAYKTLPGDLPPGMEVQLINDLGEVVYVTTTDAKGNFVFDKLPPDKNFTVRFKNMADTDVKIIAKDEASGSVKEIKKDAKGDFVYVTLNADKAAMLVLINEKDVTPVMKKFYGQAYKTLPGDLPPGMQVELVNDKGEVVMIATVDEKGNFVFDKLPSDKFFNIRIKDINDSGIQMIALNESGEKLADVKKDAKGGFVYERLAPDQMFLTMFDAKDQPVLVKASATRFNFGIIHYEYDRSDLGNNAKQELNKLIKVLKENKNVMVQLTAYTDSKGSDEYNNILSDRRAKAAHGYIVSKGINSARIKYSGKGEQNPIAPNEHPNGEDNPEGRAKNRRTEIVLMGN